MIRLSFVRIFGYILKNFLSTTNLQIEWCISDWFLKHQELDQQQNLDFKIKSKINRSKVRWCEETSTDIKQKIYEKKSDRSQD